jgi:hypothetical protein
VVPRAARDFGRRTEQRPIATVIEDLDDIEIIVCLCAVTQLDPIVSCELPVIQRIIQDETWLEGERRGCFVLSEDPLVQEHVCQVIFRIGRELRMSIMEQLAVSTEAAMQSIKAPNHERAA